MILEKLQEIFRDIFDDEELVLTYETKSSEIDRWDSLATVSMISAVCDEFDISISLSEFGMFTDVKSIVELIQSKESK